MDRDTAILMPGRSAGAGGFTLIELIVTLAILGFALVLIAGYKPLTSSGLSLDGTEDELASGLREARSAAIADNRPVTLAIDVAAHRYRIGADAMRPLPADLSIQVLTVLGERQSGSAAGIRFNPDGSSTGGRITLGLQQRQVAIGVDWLTGRVRVADVR